MDYRPNNENCFKLGPMLSEFTDPGTEQAFLGHHLAETHSQLRLTLVFCSFFYITFSMTDVARLGYGHATLILLMARLGVGIAAAAGLTLAYFKPASIPVTRLIATSIEIIGMGTFMLVVALRPSEMAWHAMSISIMLVVIYIFIPNRLLYILAVALTATAVFILLAGAIGNLDAADMLTMSMLLVLTNTFGWVAARRYQRLWREEFQAQTVLKEQSLHDHLTGCFNRRHLNNDLLEKEIARAERYKLTLSVIMCDLDHFKRINDTYGHHGGDAVLQSFAGLLKSMTRDNIDSVVRFGGEEFLLILPATGLNGAALLAERLRAALAAMTITHPDGSAIRTTASFGVATADFTTPRNAITQFRMIASADDLLYAAKNGGRNQVWSRQVP